MVLLSLFSFLSLLIWGCYMKRSLGPFEYPCFIARLHAQGRKEIALTNMLMGNFEKLPCQVHFNMRSCIL